MEVSELPLANEVPLDYHVYTKEDKSITSKQQFMYQLLESLQFFFLEKTLEIMASYVYCKKMILQ